MKISYGSDLHLEFGVDQIETSNPEGSDVLILAGDIITPWHCSQDQIDVLVEFSKSYSTVLMLMGNHEHYHGNYWQTQGGIEELIKDIPNMRLMNDQSVIIDGVKLIGSTLWTDFNQNDPIAMWDARSMMNDYRLIEGDNGRPITPEIVYEAHTHSRAFIDKEAKEHDGEVVVFTHHAPSFMSISGRYAGSKVNAAYASNMNQFVLDNKNIHCWIHGHIHNVVGYFIGDTLVVSNPRGYQDHEIFGSYEFKQIEV